MKPYYEHAGITIYHGDCRETLPFLGVTPGLLLSDPPYGMGYVPFRGADGSKRWGDRKKVIVTGDEKDFDPRHLLSGCDVALWGAHWFADKLPASGGWLTWDKTPHGRKDGFHASDVDLCWTNCRTSSRKFSMQWGGEARGGEPFYHPTQKPVALMAWCINLLLTKPGPIVDPYCGAGPTLAAAKLRGYRAIGIEIEERYCEIAAKRLGQEVFAFEEAV